jgi:hypothetical protein
MMRLYFSPTFILSNFLDNQLRDVLKGGLYYSVKGGVKLLVKGGLKC